MPLDLEQLRGAARGARPVSSLPAGPQPGRSPGLTSTGKWIVGICIVLGGLWWINKSDKQPTHVKPPSSSGGNAREAPRCTAQLKTMTSTGLCAMYWGNPSVGVCDTRIEAELSSRNVTLNDASCRGTTQASAQPRQNADTNVQSLLARLADSHRGAVQVDETTASNRELYARSINDLSGQISRSTRIESPNDGTFVYSGVSVRPFSSVVLASGANGCREKSEVVGICIQDSRGLLCGSEIFENVRGKELCIAGLRR
jgi:hypothetical protein